MDGKQIAVIVVIGILALGGIGMMFSGSNGDEPTNMQKPTSQGETRDEMMNRMHPPAATNNANKGMDTISFSNAVGQPAPDFTLPAQDGSTFTLSDYKDKTVVLFFSGGAMCYPACWSQIGALGEDERFNNDEVITASIVVDAKEKWDKIIRSQPKYGVGTILLDTNKAVSQAYDMLNAQSSMHKGNIPGHTYLVIKNGIITYMYDDPTMSLNTDLIATNV